jgi:hypothetical protein
MLASVVCACAGSTPPPAPADVSVAPPPSAGARHSEPRRPTAPTVAWHYDFPSSVEARRVAVGADGTIAVGVRFSEQVELAGRSLEPRGEGDVAIAFFAADGTPLGAVQLGGRADDALEDLAATASGFVVAVRSDEGFVEAGRTADPGPGFEGAALVVHVRAPGEIVRADAVPRGARGLRLASHGSGELFVGWSVHGGDELFGEATVSRTGPDGAERWRQSYAGCQIHELAAEAPRVLASLRCRRSLEARSLSDRDGGTVRHLVVEKLPSAGDLGSLQAFFGKGAMLAFGETGGAVRVGGADRERPSYAIQPFFAEASQAGTELFVDLADATANVVGVGSLDAVPVAVINVMHPGANPEPQPGIYLAAVASGSAPKLRLLAHRELRPELPDPPLHPWHVAFVEGGVLAVGTLGVSRRSSTVVRYDLPRVR